MVLRCSLLGHDYGEAEVEHEREERGSEVVVTVQEYEECSRCGDRHLISENTEVTSLPPETESESAAGSASPPKAEPTDTPPTEPSADAQTDIPFRAGTETETEAGHAADEYEDDEFGPDFPTDEHGDPITDDGEILDDEPEVDGREHGEWPDSDDVGPPVGAENEPTAWPDADADADSDGESGSGDESVTFDEDDTNAGDEPEGTDEAVAGEDIEPTDDAVFIDAGPDTDADIGLETPPAFGSDATPDAHADGESNATDAGTGITSAQSAPVPGESSAPEGVPTEFFCPRCAFVAPGDRGSLRPGDICPDCRKGYLGERER